MAAIRSAILLLLKLVFDGCADDPSSPVVCLRILSILLSVGGFRRLLVAVLRRAVNDEVGDGIEG